MNKVGGRALLLSLVWVLFATVPVAADEQERLIVRAPKPYDSLVAAVRRLGGKIHHQYENVDALAVSLPSHRVADLVALARRRRCNLRRHQAAATWPRWRGIEAGAHGDHSPRLPQVAPSDARDRKDGEAWRPGRQNALGEVA